MPYRLAACSSLLGVQHSTHCLTRQHACVVRALSWLAAGSSDIASRLFKLDGTLVIRFVWCLGPRAFCKDAICVRLCRHMVLSCHCIGVSGCEPHVRHDVACAYAALQSYTAMRMDLFALPLEGLFHKLHFATVGPGLVTTRGHCCDQVPST